MRTLYIDCGMGAAGDMLSAALLELLPDPDAFIAEFNALGIPGVKAARKSDQKCGITGTRFCVSIHGTEEDEHLHDHGHNHSHHHGHHHHNGLADIRSIVMKLPIPVMVKLDVMAVYNLIAEAESQVHGVSMEHIHFHEVGSMDAVADITAVCMLMHRLAPDQILASPIHVGSGSVRCAHGILPVPAPATALLLKDIPIYSGSISGELCTPTGAALLRHFVTRFGEMPVMRLQKTGYGMGKKDFPRANCVRTLLGDTQSPSDQIAELTCNVDDMTGESVGFALDTLMQCGALDFFTTPTVMKKSRPGIQITVLCREADREKMVQLLFRHTTTLGIRESLCRRYTLERRVETLPTPMGSVRRKVSTGYGVTRSKLEYEDLARIARESGMSLESIRKQIEKQISE